MAEGEAAGWRLLEEQRQQVVPFLSPEQLKSYFKSAPTAPTAAVAQRRVEQWEKLKMEEARQWAVEKAKQYAEEVKRATPD